MKKKLLLAGAFCAAASMAQAAPTLYEFYLFRADGAVHTIANADVDSITFERADTEGNPTEAFATQVIHLKDGTKLRTAFANISDVCLADPVSQPADSVVDLGLSVGWRACNIGGTTAADYGDLVGWGAPTGKHHEQYHTSNYGAYNRNKNTCLEYYGGITPPDDISGTEYDIARTQLGGEWRMPTLAEMTELKDKTKSLWMTYRGAEGVLLEGPSGARIFMPAAGRRRGETMVSQPDEFGGYWTSGWYGTSDSTSATKGEMAWSFNFGIQQGQGFMTIVSSYRYTGSSVRPVKDLK